METAKTNEEEMRQILSRKEDHFCDFKSKKIKPAKVQETFVAFANSDGGEIYIGIEDDRVINGFGSNEEANDIITTLLEETNPAVENVNIDFLQINKDIILHFSIPKSPKVHYTSSGECFLRVNASSKKIKGERITHLAYSKGAEAYERKPLINVDIEEILESIHLESYLNRINSFMDKYRFLKKQRLLSKYDSKDFPNPACVLLFDDEPQATLETRCAVKVHRLRTTEKGYKREQLEEIPVTINGTVEEMITKTLIQVQKYIDSVSFMADKQVKLTYPTETLKEILVNAIIHRDYSLNDDIHVRIFDNRVEVQSPGKLPGYMTVDNLYEERFSRNPNLVRMLHNLPNPVNHDIGEGLDTAKNELKKVGLIAPAFEEKENSFLVTIKHQKIASIDDVVMKYFEENPKGKITNKLVRQLSGEDDMQKVKRALQKLKSQGFIEVEDENAKAFDYKYIKSTKNQTNSLFPELD